MTHTDLPYSIETEQAVLGAILFDNNVFWRLDGLECEHFYDPVHQLVYGFIESAIRSSKAATPIGLDAYLSGRDELEAVGGRSYLTNLSRAVPSTVGAPEYARVITELYTRRQIISIGEDAIQRAHAAEIDDDPAAILEHVQSSLHGLESRAFPERAQQSPEEQTEDWLNGVLERCQSGGIPGVTTGLAELDGYLGGLQGGNLIALAGRPGSGKTTFAQRLLEGCISSERSACMFSLEMPQGQLRSRLASSMLHGTGEKISYQAIQNGDLNLTQQEALMSLAKPLCTPLLNIIDRTGMTASYIAGAIKRWKNAEERAGREPGIVVIDHMGHIRDEPGTSKLNTASKVGLKSKILLAAAKELDLPIVILVQLNRGVESRDDRRPRLSDLRDSGEIEEDVAQAIFLYRPAYYLEREEPDQSDEAAYADWLQALRKREFDLDVLIEKNRHGRVGQFTAYTDIKLAVVRDAPDTRRAA